MTFDERDVWDWFIENPKIEEVTLNYQQNEDNYYIQPSSVTQDPQTGLTECPQRQRQMPTRLQDYIIMVDDVFLTKILLILLLVVDCDPIVYEEQPVMIVG